MFRTDGIGMHRHFCLQIMMQDFQIPEWYNEMGLWHCNGFGETDSYLLKLVEWFLGLAIVGRCDFIVAFTKISINTPHTSFTRPPKLRIPNTIQGNDNMNIVKDV